MADLIVVRQPQNHVVIQSTPTRVEIEAPGPQGATGPEGDPGAPGGASFEFEQASPLTQWNIPHMLNKYPHVTLIGADGAKYWAKVVYVDLNNVSIIHNQPVAGKAELS